MDQIVCSDAQLKHPSLEQMWMKHKLINPCQGYAGSPHVLAVCFKDCSEQF